MLDLKKLRENPAWYLERLARRDPALKEELAKVLELNKTRRECQTDKQKLLALRKKLSREIGALKSSDPSGAASLALSKRVREIGKDISKIDEDFDKFKQKENYALLSLPNIPHEDSPVGTDSQANRVIRSWQGDLSIEDIDKINKRAVDHVEICERLGLADFKIAAKVSGSGFVFLTGDGARLARALINFMLDLHINKHGYQEISPPVLISENAMIGTGQLPKFEEDMYKCSRDDLYLAPTAEVPLTNILRESILPLAELPKKFCAYTPCFRREAGSAGRDARGLMRLHQFDKVELVQACRQEESEKSLEKLCEHAEKVLRLLELPYRVIDLCSGDLGFSAHRTYDIELWSPARGQYLEVSSCSNFRGFQARRMKLRYKNEEGQNIAAHTLNGSGVALPRLLIALLETRFNKDGELPLPKVLWDYFGARTIARKS